jgi:hypothetical protein
LSCPSSGGKTFEDDVCFVSAGGVFDDFWRLSDLDCESELPCGALRFIDAVVMQKLNLGGETSPSVILLDKGNIGGFFSEKWRLL